MSKGDKQRGNREVKKPKKAKAVVVVDASKGKSPLNIGESKKK